MLVIFLKPISKIFFLDISVLDIESSFLICKIWNHSIIYWCSVIKLCQSSILMFCHCRIDVAILSHFWWSATLVSESHHKNILINGSCCTKINAFHFCNGVIMYFFVISTIISVFPGELNCEYITKKSIMLPYFLNKVIMNGL